MFVGDVQVALGVHGDVVRASELCARGRPSVSAESVDAVARDRRVIVPPAIFRTRLFPLSATYRLSSASTARPKGPLEFGRRGRDVVAVEPGLAVSRDRRDRPVLDLADSLVAGVGDIERSLRVDGDASRIGQLSLDGRAAVSAEAALPGAGHRRRPPLLSFRTVLSSKSAMYRSPSGPTATAAGSSIDATVTIVSVPDTPSAPGTATATAVASDAAATASERRSG